MFVAIVFALLSVASAQKYLNAGNPIINRQVGYNTAALREVYPQSYVSQSVVPQRYVAQPYGRKVVAQPYGQYNEGVQERDFDIERIGERHSLQTGGNQFQYSFLRGDNVRQVESPLQVQRYGVPQVQQYGVDTFARLRAGPAVRKVDVYGGKNLIK